MAGGLSLATRPSVVTVPPSAEGLALLDFLALRFPAISRRTWKDRLDQGKVLAESGSPLREESSLKAGARLFYFREVEVEPRVSGSVEVLLETADFLLVDKPPGLPVHPTGPFVRETLLGRLEQTTGLEELAAAHRLDLETSGLVLVTKRAESRGLYQQLFAQGEVSKEYLALAHLPAEPAVQRWRVENRLERGEPWFRMRVVPGEVNARTESELLSWRDGVGRFRLVPETGKKHQLRIHMAGLGFPILGDRYYPDLLSRAASGVGAGLVPARVAGDDRKGRPRGSPLRLLAWRLGFRDPLTGEAVAVESRRDLAGGLEGDGDGLSLAAGAALR